MNCRTNVQQMNVLFEMGKELESLVNNLIGVKSITVDGIEYFPDEEGNISIVIDAVKKINYDGDIFIPNTDGLVTINSHAVKMVQINNIPFYPDANGDLYATCDTSTLVYDKGDYFQLVCEYANDISTLTDYTDYWLLMTNNLMIIGGIYYLSSSSSLSIFDDNDGYIITV